jgi:ribosomal-protein-alanine N-acetyltransferase
MTIEPRFALREVQPGDARALASAETVCFDDPWPEPYFITELFAPGRFQRVLVDVNGSLAAYLFTAWQYLDLHILKVATLPVFRRHGLGRRLMLVAEGHAREMAGESLTLEVRIANTPAIAMYGALGYEKVGIRPGDYPDGSDALVMTKAIRLTN